MIYFDNAATTAVSPAAIAAACQSMREDYYNPSSRYPAAVQTAKHLAEHRKAVAAALGCKPAEVVFTSCGSESDNWALRIGAENGKRRGKHIITTAIEHAAILEPCKRLEQEGYEVTVLPANAAGTIDLDALEAAVRPDTVLVSMMLVNNELGTVLPVAEAVRRIKRRNPNTLVHTDAVQAFLKVPFTPQQLGVDLLSISGHKVHAPKGIGALYIKSGLRTQPLIAGGGQENGLRSGTEATAQIAAFAAACTEGKAHFQRDYAHMTELKEYTLAHLAEVGVEVLASGDAPHILALTMSGYKSEVLVRVLGDKGICVSAGSACHRGKPSHVYAAMGLSKAQRDGAFRVSFCGENTKEDVDALLAALSEAKAMLFPSMS